MHIAIVRTEFVKSRGGAERYAVNLARHWLEQGHRISVVCARLDPADAEGMEVVEVSRPKVLGPFKHAWFARKAGRAARECGAEAVLCLARAFPGDLMRLGDGLHAMQMEASYGETGARLHAKLNPRHRELLKLERELFAQGRFGLYVANSAMIRDEVTRRFGVDETLVEVIPNGVDGRTFHLATRGGRDALRERHGIPPDAKLVLFSGVDFRRKGLMEAVRGFVELAKQRDDVHFACVGPDSGDEAERALRAAGTIDRSSMVGGMQEMAGWYGAADVFVLPSSHDPSANAVTESLACGTPVITSAQNGAKQHVVEGENGFVLEDRDDPVELAGRMDEILERMPDPEAVASQAELISHEESSARMLDALNRAARKRRSGSVEEPSRS